MSETRVILGNLKWILHPTEIVIGLVLVSGKIVN